MRHTEHDLKELLAEHGEDGSGGAARLEAIIAKGRRIRRRRRWAATGTLATALAVVAVLPPVLLRGGGATDAQIAAKVQEPREEGVRLAGARFENVGKVETISFTPKSDRTSYRVNCAGPVQTFVRFGDQVDHGRCGSEQGQEWSTLGRLEGAEEGAAADVEVFTVSNAQVPPDITAETELSGADFDRVLARARPGSGLWEIAIHDGGASTRSCSPDICLSHGTMPATGGERNLAGLPDSQVVENRYFTEINTRFRVKAALRGTVYVRCEGEDLYAFIWPGATGEGTAVTVQSCGPKPARWDFENSEGTTVAVVPRDQVPDDLYSGSDPEKGANLVEELLGRLKPAPGSWEVSVQQREDTQSQAKRYYGLENPIDSSDGH